MLSAEMAVPSKLTCIALLAIFSMNNLLYVRHTLNCIILVTDSQTVAVLQLMFEYCCHKLTK